MTKANERITNLNRDFAPKEHLCVILAFVSVAENIKKLPLR